MTTDIDEFVGDVLLSYVNALSYETISRNPSSPIRLAPLHLEHRNRLLVAAEAIRSRHQSSAGQFSKWSSWTIDGLPGAVGPEL